MAHRRGDLSSAHRLKSIISVNSKEHTEDVKKQQEPDEIRVLDRRVVMATDKSEAGGEKKLEMNQN